MRSSLGFGPVRVNQELTSGIANSLEAAFAFVEWADSMGKRLTWEGIREKYECNRSTAYRWLDAYRQFCEKRDAKMKRAA